jgi:hypothetical protein
MTEARSLKLPDSKRAYLASVTHAKTMQAQTVSRVENALTDTPGRGRNPTDFGYAAEIWT